MALITRAKQNAETIIQRRNEESDYKLKDSLGTFLPAILADLNGALALLEDCEAGAARWRKIRPLLSVEADGQNAQIVVVDTNELYNQTWHEGKHTVEELMDFVLEPGVPNGS